MSQKTLINSEISEITQKIAALDAIRDRLEQELLNLQEDELELDDERTSSSLRFLPILICFS